MAKKLLIFYTGVVLILSCGITMAGQTPGHGAHEHEQKKKTPVGTVKAAYKGVNAVPAEAKCPVCGMFVAKYQDWSTIATFKDGTTFYYDGPKDMFSHFLDPGRYTSGKRQSDIVALAVKEYYSLEVIDARAAFFVVGSDVHGPMGSELVPFQNEKDARSFKVDHKGKRILRFNEITQQTIKSLN